MAEDKPANPKPSKPDQSGDKKASKPDQPDDQDASQPDQPDDTKASPSDQLVNQKGSKSDDGALMTSALYNLMIAQQYIDATRLVPEYRLVCFHYAVALLAAHRNDKTQRALARQYFDAALGSKADKDANPDIRESIDRIVCESHYNIGVIDELDKLYPNAKESYQQAAAIAEKYRGKPENVGKFENVAVLAGLGSISSDMPAISDRWERIKMQHKALRKLKGKSQDAANQLVKLLTNQEGKFLIKIREALAEIFALTERVRRLIEIVPEPGRKPKSTNQSPPGILNRTMQLFVSAVAPAPSSKADVKQVQPSDTEPHGVLRKHEILIQIQNKLTSFKRELTTIESEIKVQQREFQAPPLPQTTLMNPIRLKKTASAPEAVDEGKAPDGGTESQP
ncbi:MAG: hypothetical protein ACLPLZ_04195 [Terracidiphilus sp.]